MSNHNAQSVEFNLPESKDGLIKAIVAITGEDARLLHTKSIAELKSHLGKLAKSLADTKDRLFEEHNQSTEYSDLEAFEKWRLVDRGILKGSKNRFGKKVTEERMRFLMSKLVNVTIFRAENNMPISDISASRLANVAANVNINRLGYATITNRASFMSTEKMKLTVNSPITNAAKAI
jgi:hypothetical protein